MRQIERLQWRRRGQLTLPRIELEVKPVEQVSVPLRIEAFVRPEGRAEQLKIVYASTFHLRRILRTRADRSEKLKPAESRA
jgi:hypothetical protein